MRRLYQNDYELVVRFAKYVGGVLLTKYLNDEGPI